MLDQTTRKGRILAAALSCAAAKSWAEVTLSDIAEAAELPLADLRGEFASKTEIIAALLRAVDDEVLKRAAKRGESQEKRDALFDIVMTRFDVLGPHKAALKSIHASGPADFALAGPFLSSQHWMLEAAGIATDGPTGALRVAGLGLAYASVFRTWLEDDDAGPRPHHGRPRPAAAAWRAHARRHRERGLRTQPLRHRRAGFPALGAARSLHADAPSGPEAGTL